MEIDNIDVIGDRIVRQSDGSVLLRHYNPNSVPVHIEEDGTDYFFTTTSPYDNLVHTSDVPAAWIKPQHVDKLLSVLAMMCCGKRNPKFRLASQSEYYVWARGTRD